ncbi:MAG: small subunit ribosomal protein [Thermotogaceae bacterium]|jgi:small subunit ribosomal protein S17|nr:small subunit ribosomal protein [Thermotogaceae bacterium]
MPRRILTGEVVSDKMEKTVVVEVKRQIKHAVTGKRVKKTKKFMAHDEENKCKIADVVRIIESKPMSKHKRWEVLEIVKRDILDEEEIKVLETEGGEEQ